MNKVAILTITSLNLGNRLQNYALQTVLEKMGFQAETLLRSNKHIVDAKQIIRARLIDDKYSRFYRFNKKIKWSNYKVTSGYVSSNIQDKYDKFVVGSDQIWNPTFYFSSILDYLPMVEASRKFSYAASFGGSTIPKEYEQMVSDGLTSFELISVRENEAVSIVRNLASKNAEVVLDPTLLLNRNDWLMIQEPVDFIRTDEKYILKYFLGSNYDVIVDYVAKSYGYKIIDATEKKLPIGPAEFIYLIDNAEMVLTDSFHACVFSFIFNKPFVVFERESISLDMYSRINTFCSSFKLRDHIYFDGYSSWNLKYSKESFFLLNSRRRHSLNYLQNAMKL